MQIEQKLSFNLDKEFNFWQICVTEVVIICLKNICTIITLQTINNCNVIKLHNVYKMAKEERIVKLIYIQLYLEI